MLVLIDEALLSPTKPQNVKPPHLNVHNCLFHLQLCSHLQSVPSICNQSSYPAWLSPLSLFSWCNLLPLAAADGFWCSDWVGLCNTSVDPSPACGHHLPAPGLFHYFARRWSRCDICWRHFACHLHQKVRNNRLLGNLMVFTHLASWDVLWIGNMMRNWHVSTSEMLAIWSLLHSSITQQQNLHHHWTIMKVRNPLYIRYVIFIPWINKPLKLMEWQT